MSKTLEEVLREEAHRCGVGMGLAGYGGESGTFWDIRYLTLRDIADKMEIDKEGLTEQRKIGESKAFTWKGPV